MQRVASEISEEVGQARVPSSLIDRNEPFLNLRHGKARASLQLVWNRCWASRSLNVKMVGKGLSSLLLSVFSGSAAGVSVEAASCEVHRTDELRVNLTAVYAAVPA